MLSGDFISIFGVYVCRCVRTAYIFFLVDVCARHRNKQKINLCLWMQAETNDGG